MRTIKKQNEHDDPSLETAVFLKMGDFITPSEFQFFKKRNGGRNVIFNRRYISNRKIAVVGNGFVFGVFCFQKEKEPITAAHGWLVIGSASLRLAL